MLFAQKSKTFPSLPTNTVACNTSVSKAYAKVKPKIASTNNERFLLTRYSARRLKKIRNERIPNIAR